MFMVWPTSNPRRSARAMGRWMGLTRFAIQILRITARIHSDPKALTTTANLAEKKKKEENRHGGEHVSVEWVSVESVDTVSGSTPQAEPSQRYEGAWCKPQSQDESGRRHREHQDHRRCPAVCPECGEGRCRFDLYHADGHWCDLCGYYEETDALAKQESSQKVTPEEPESVQALLSSTMESESVESVEALLSSIMANLVKKKKKGSVESVESVEALLSSIMANLAEKKKKESVESVESEGIVTEESTPRPWSLFPWAKIPVAAAGATKKLAPPTPKKPAPPTPKTAPPPKAHPPNQPPPPTAQTMLCPLCDGPMEIRRAGRGGKFWGCLGFPGCRGTRGFSNPSACSPIAEVRARAANA